jgi:hypothetical protein
MLSGRIVDLYVNRKLENRFYTIETLTNVTSDKYCETYKTIFNFFNQYKCKPLIFKKYKTIHIF